MSKHNGRVVKPTDDDRQIINLLLDALMPASHLLKSYIVGIQAEHLFLETELVNLNWILTHLQEAEKELNRLKERVRDDG
jgi:hypothetical protein